MTEQAKPLSVEEIVTYELHGTVFDGSSEYGLRHRIADTIDDLRRQVTELTARNAALVEALRLGLCDHVDFAGICNDCRGGIEATLANNAPPCSPTNPCQGHPVGTVNPHCSVGHPVSDWTDSACPQCANDAQKEG